ncbi:MAG: hypothetical protein QM747_03200 [Nocardioides sp.]
MSFLDLDGLPERCPLWCRQDHKQAIYEGNSAEQSRVHHGDEFGHQLNDVHGYDGVRVDRPGSASWDLLLTKDEPGTHSALPIVELRCETGRIENDERRATTLHLTTSEARSLAAQLTRLADLGEFHEFS